MKTVLLLLISNVFMTFAWYGHLKDANQPLLKAVLFAWGLALFEYCFMVPANRIGYTSGWSGFQLKITQEAITVVVFTVFAILYLKERMAWNHAAAFAMILGAVWLTWGFRPETP